MKIKNLLLCGAAAALCACEPLDDTNWVGNSLPTLDWETVTGTSTRPEGIKKMTVRYVPQTDGNPLYEYPMPDNSGAFDVQTGCYDVIALSGDYEVSGLGLYKTAALTIPYQMNAAGEKVVSENPEMVYVGTATGTYCDYLHRKAFTVAMKKVLKRINFVVNIGDEKELVEDCQLELAGMATRMNLATLSPVGTEEVVHSFSLCKEGRHWNEEGNLTTYKGYIHCLGVQGKNILEITFTDADHHRRTIRTDVSSFLANWNTDEVTIRFTINVNGEDTRLQLDGFEMGNTTDLEFNC